MTLNIFVSLLSFTGRTYKKIVSTEYTVGLQKYTDESSIWEVYNFSYEFLINNFNEKDFYIQ